MCAQPVLTTLVMALLNLQRQVGVGTLLGDYRRLDFAIGGYSPLWPPPRTAPSEKDLKLAGTSFETNDDYDFNGVNANEAMLLYNITT